jgi:hypothetical protein
MFAIAGPQQKANKTAETTHQSHGPEILSNIFFILWSPYYGLKIGLPIVRLFAGAKAFNTGNTL